MSGIYYTDLLDVLRAAGCTVQESSTTDGWQRRARSSGGFPAAPLCVFWHNTASQTSPANDLNYMINVNDDAPVGNMLIDRNGVCWPIAAGASNCAGKSETAKSFSRGTIPVSQGNTMGWQIECANAGTGVEPWSVAQVDALFRASNALSVRFGNLPSDIISHALGAGDGYTNRKVDPATADAVQGLWRPRSTNSSGTWALADMRNECTARAGQAPTPPNPDDGDDDMAYACEGLWVLGDDNGNPYGMTVAVYAGGYKTWLPDNDALAQKQNLCTIHGVKGDVQVQTNVDMWRAFGPLVGPVPSGYDSFGVPL